MNNSKTLFFIFILNILFWDSSFTQNPEWKVYDTSNSSLPSNYVNSVAEDLDGNIWVGTYGGLIKITDQGWHLYTKSNFNIPSNDIETIAVDKDNCIWIGFHGTGIAKYYDGIMEHFTSENSILPSNYIRKIVVDRINRKWVATALGSGVGGVVVVEDTSWTSYTDENSELPIGTVSSVEVDDSLNVWISMDYIIIDKCSNLSKITQYGGLAKFDGTYWEFFDHNTPGFSSGNISCIESNKDTVWVGTDWGLSMYDGDTWQTYKEDDSDLPNNYVNAVFVDSSNVKWLGLGRKTFDRKGALAKYYNGYYTVFDTTNSPILTGFVTSIFIDSDNNKWICIQPYWDQSTISSYGGGLAIYNEKGVIINIENGKNSKIPGFYLAGNYPNPFNPNTTIKYSLSENGHVQLKVYDILGREITTMVDEFQTLGNYKVRFDGTNLPSGIYLYSLKFGNLYMSKKMIILR